MFPNPIGFLLSPLKQWQKVTDLNPSFYNKALLYPLILALLPCIAWYYGTAVAGWSIAGSEDVVRLEAHSAKMIISAFYFTMIISIAVIGYSVHWMAQTYGCESSIAKGIAVSGFAATPLFLVGLVGFVPLLWLDLSLGIVAASWATYLLYKGIPIVMKIPEEQGFLYTSAIIGVCFVILMAIMGGTVILWDYGFMPVFTD